MSSRAPMHRSSSNYAATAGPPLRQPAVERQRLAEQRVHGDPATALALLRPVEHYRRDACLGSVSEILEDDAPHLPVGCVAQAWGVAELLRVWLADSEVRAP